MKKALILFFITCFFYSTNIANNPVDSTSANLFAWKINKLNLNRYYVSIDTTLDNDHIYFPFQYHKPFNTFLGNLGTAYETNIFPERELNNDFIFIQPFEKYLNLSESVIYYHTKKPFTHFIYNTSMGSKEQKEELIKLFHTQNVNTDLNFGFSYDRTSSNGLYVNQKAITSAFGIFSSYSNHKYFFYLNANINSIKYDENGGLADVESFVNESEDPGTYASRLNNANAVMKNKNVFLTHGYTFSLFKSKEMVDSVMIEETKLQGILLHKFIFDQSIRTFQDVLAQKYNSTDTTEDWVYYKGLPSINELETFDSANLRTISNYIQYQMEPGENAWLKSGLRIGLGNELQKYTINSLDTSGMIEGYNDEQINTFLSSELYNSSGINWNWSIYGRYYFSGYKLNNTELTAHLGKHIKLWTDTGFVSIGWVNKTTRPNYFYNYYYSNHLRWNNNFKNINETNLSASVNIDSRKLKLEAHYSLIDNYIYRSWVDSFMPSQSAEPLNVLSVSLSKAFKFWKIYTCNLIAYQAVSNTTYLNLPAISLYNSTYFEQTIVRNVLDARLGFDITYNTLYYADGFMASYGMFYNQKYREVGNYPFADVYISAKLKRTMFLLKYCHVNEGLLPREYFTSYSYPMNYRKLMFGISWMFYD